MNFCIDSFLNDKFTFGIIQEEWNTIHINEPIEVVIEEMKKELKRRNLKISK